MDLKPIADLVTQISWSEIVSGLIGAGVVAVLNLWIGHGLAKSRDTANREGNEEIQKKAEARHERTLDDQRRDQDQQREQKERLQAVKSYYVAYTEALSFRDTYRAQLDLLKTTTRIFRLEAIALDSEMEKQVTKILSIMDQMEEFYESLSLPASKRAHRTLIHMSNLQEGLFAELMIWGLHGKSRKVGELMDANLADVKSW